MTGLLLLTGGQGRRMGAPKHRLPYPGGGSWGGHLARIFAGVWPSGALAVLGDPLPDRPDLPRFDDPRQGPAIALSLWCASAAPSVDRWWVVGCDQVHWTPERLAAWFRRVEAADPDATRWVLAEQGGRLQPLGGFLAGSLRAAVAAATEPSLTRLAQAVPHRVLPAAGPEWQDLDTPEDRRAFEEGR